MMSIVHNCVYCLHIFSGMYIFGSSTPETYILDVIEQFIGNNEECK